MPLAIEDNVATDTASTEEPGFDEFLPCDGYCTWLDYEQYDAAARIPLILARLVSRTCMLIGSHVLLIVAVAGARQFKFPAWLEPVTCIYRP